MISESSGKYLLEIAKKAVYEYITNGKTLEIPKDCPSELHEKLGVFVTINKNNRLRGGHFELIRTSQVHAGNLLAEIGRAHV